MSLPMRGAWIEIYLYLECTKAGTTSLPMRGAWIEIYGLADSTFALNVAPHAGSVD